MNHPASTAYSPVHYPMLTYGRLSPSGGQGRAKFSYGGYGQSELTSNTVIGQGLGFDYGPVSSTAGYVVSSSGYPLGSASYPISSAGYPVTSGGYPASSAGYPASSAGYPASSAGYPASSAGYPLSSAGYAISTAGYPISSAFAGGNVSALWPISPSHQQSSRRPDQQQPISSAAAATAALQQMYFSSVAASSAAQLPPPPLPAQSLHQPPPVSMSVAVSQYGNNRQQRQQQLQPQLMPVSMFGNSLPLNSAGGANYPRLSYAVAGPSATQQYQVSYAANNPRMYGAFPVGGYRPMSANRDEDEAGGGTMNKPKTPMAQLNEIAKHNRVSTQYILIDEQGPAHRKTFFIKLRFGREEYQASGLSIKKAQHSAAERALEATAYPRPTARDLRELAKRRRELRALGPPPILELGSVASKRGETARYETLSTPPSPADASPTTPTLSPTLFSVRLTVGERKFLANGPSLHAARQNAAIKALRLFKSEQFNGDASPVSSGAVVDYENGGTSEVDAEEAGQDEEDDDERPPANKSDVSLLYEVANKRRWRVEFDLETENGPAHMKTFRYTCRVDDLVCQAEGKSKMTAKKTCATKMLELVRERLGDEAYEQTVAMKSKSYYAKAFDNRKKTKNVIKEQKADPQYGNQVNPISRLIQITQARKQKDPVYSLSQDRPTGGGYSRHREYHIDCHLPSTGERSRGIGPNKKLAKRVAAEAMLELMGYRRHDPPVPRKSALKTAPTQPQPALTPTAAAMAIDASDAAAVAAASAAVAAAVSPGIGGCNKKVAIASARGTLGGEGLPALPNHTDLPMSTLGRIARELLTEGQSLTAESINPGAACLRGRHRPKAQLLYLCEAAGCSLEFADSARQQEHGRTLYSSKVLVGVQGRLPDLSAECDSVEGAHDAAATLALEKLAQLALTAQQPAPPAVDDAAAVTAAVSA